MVFSTATLSIAGLAATVQPTTLPEVLARSARYVAAYQERLSSVVAEERYEQRLESAAQSRFEPFGRTPSAQVERRSRVLVSDYLLARAPGEGGWVPFRDVYEVDGSTVRDRQERLLELFVASPETAWDRAAEIAEESARFNIGSVRRTVNMPTLALLLLSDENQKRLKFELEDRRRSGDSDTELWRVSYREESSPTLIRGRGDADLPVFGSFWIDPSDGGVVASVLRTKERDLESRIEVTYELAAELGLRLPSEMKEEYRTGYGETIEGTATYGRFRQFQVQTSERVR